MCDIAVIPTHCVNPHLWHMSHCGKRVPVMRHDVKQCVQLHVWHVWHVWHCSNSHTSCEPASMIYVTLRQNKFISTHPHVHHTPYLIVPVYSINPHLAHMSHCGKINSFVYTHTPYLSSSINPHLWYMSHCGKTNPFPPIHMYTHTPYLSSSNVFHPPTSESYITMWDFQWTNSPSTPTPQSLLVSTHPSFSWSPFHFHPPSTHPSSSYSWIHCSSPLHISSSCSSDPKLSPGVHINLVLYSILVLPIHSIHPHLHQTSYCRAFNSNASHPPASMPYTTLRYFQCIPPTHIHAIYNIAVLPMHSIHLSMYICKPILLHVWHCVTWLTPVCGPASIPYAILRYLLSLLSIPCGHMSSYSLLFFANYHPTPSQHHFLHHLLTRIYLFWWHAAHFFWPLTVSTSRIPLLFSYAAPSTHFPFLSLILMHCKVSHTNPYLLLFLPLHGLCNTIFPYMVKEPSL